MIIYGINDIYRERLYRCDVNRVIYYINDLSLTNKDRCMHIIINDCYQILSKRKSELADSTSKKLLSIIESSDFSDIKFILEDNYKLFQILYVYAKAFWELPIIDRCILIGNVNSKEKQEKLIELDPVYASDMCVYNVQKDLDSINYYHQDYCNKTRIVDIDNFYNLVTKIMSQLKLEDRKLYFENLLEIMKGFYINHKFLENMDGSLVNFSKKYSELLENTSLEVVEEQLSQSHEHFSDVICQYFAFKTELEKADFIKKFIDEKISADMVKKLKINL